MKIKDLVNIFAYLASITSFLAVFRFIDLVFSIIFLLSLLISFYQEKNNRFFIPRWLLNILGILLVVISVFEAIYTDPVEPAIEALLAILGIKLLENKSTRDYFQIFLLSVFILSGRALLSIDIAFLVFFLLLLFIVSIGLVLTTFFSQDKNINFTKKETVSIILKLSFIPLVAIPFSIFIFLALPRMSYPMFGFLNKNKAGISGFSSDIELGDVSDIQESNQIAFRFKTDKKLENLKKIYIRGIVLDTFDGKKWKRRHSISKRRLTRVKGKVIMQDVYLSPYGDLYLFGMNVPVRIRRIPYRQYDDFIFESRKPIVKPVRYEVMSVIANEIPDEYIDYQRYLQLPDSISKELINFALELKKGKDDREFAEYLKEFFKSNFTYSISSLPKSKSPLEEFLFKEKRGNCEYFASATAVLLRINKIPARLVVGYKGVEYNQIADYYIVPQKNAHAWVEYYYNGKWITLDTTPPSRTIFLTQKRNFDILFRLRLFFDTINYYYIKFVVNFDSSSQRIVLRKVTESIYKTKLFLSRYKNYILAVVVILPLLAIALVKAYSYINTPLEKRVLNRFLKIMEKKGYKKKNNEGLEEFLERITDNKTKEVARRWIEIYQEVVFKDKKLDKATYKLLKNIENLLK